MRETIVIKQKKKKTGCNEKQTQFLITSIQQNIFDTNRGRKADLQGKF